MQHAILYGEHELLLDDKNRLLVPAEIRKALDPERDGQAFFMVVGQNGKLWFYPEVSYVQLAAERKSELTPDEDVLAFEQMHYAQASRILWDGQGRAVLPAKALDRVGIGKDDREMTLIGVRDHLELWKRHEWEERAAELTLRKSEVAQRARAARSPGP